MANRLKMATVQAILQLHSLRWSQRRIAEELEIDRKTVRRHLLRHLGGPNAPKAPTGSEGPKRTTLDLVPAPDNEPSDPVDPADLSAISNAPRAPTGSPAPLDDHRRAGVAGQRSACEPHRELILAKLEQGLSSQRIHQDLAANHGFTASYWSVRRFVQRLTGRTPLPMRRMEVEPGEEAQIDFGSGVPITLSDHSAGGARKRRKTHVFRIVLSHSRKGYSEGGLPPDDRRLPAGDGECLLAFRRRAQDAGDRQSQGGRRASRLVRSRTESQGALVLPALRHGDLAHQALHAAAQGQDRARHRLRQGQRAQGAHVHFARSPESALWSSGNGAWPTRGSTARPSSRSARCLPKSSVRRSGRCPPSASRRSRKLDGSSAATGTSKWPRRITRCRRSIWAARSGRAGTPGWCESSTAAWSRSPCTCGRSRAASARWASIWSPRRSAASSAGPSGC